MNDTKLLDMQKESCEQVEKKNQNGCVVIWGEAIVQSTAEEAQQ